MYKQTKPVKETDQQYIWAHKTLYEFPIDIKSI